MNHPPTVRYVGTRLPQAFFNLLIVNPFGWGTDWAWALPLIVLTVVIHTIGLGFLSQAARSRRQQNSRQPSRHDRVSSGHGAPPSCSPPAFTG